jgi:hypothetical protein
MLHILKDSENASCGHANLQEIAPSIYLEMKFGNPYGEMKIGRD